jgi:hypothetical protein
VRGRAHAGQVQLRDRGPVVAGLEPVGAGGLPVAVGLVQPGRAAVDGAVHEQLHTVDLPQPAPSALLRHQGRDALAGVAGSAPRVQAQPQRQASLLVESGQQVEGVAVAVHDVPAGEAGGGHAAQQAGEPLEPLVEGLDRHHLVDERHGFLLEQEAGGRTVPVDDDGRGGREASDAVHTSAAQRLGAGDRAVPVEQPHQRRTTAEPPHPRANGGHNGGQETPSRPARMAPLPRSGARR